MVSRDIMIVGAVLLSTGCSASRSVIQPLLVSKANTAAQILFAALVLAALGLKIDLAWPILIVDGGGGADPASAAAYLAAWMRHMSADD
ncbi:MAG: hypothetical protein QM722_00985 [Piscinibacter sp.]